MKKFLLTLAALLFAVQANAKCFTITGGALNQPTRFDSVKATIFPFRDLQFSVERIAGDGTLGAYELLGSLKVPPVGEFSLGLVTATELVDQTFFGIDEPYITIRVNTPPAPGVTAKICLNEHPVLQTVAKKTTNDNTQHDILTIPIPVGSSYYMEFRVNGVQTGAGDSHQAGDAISAFCVGFATRVGETTTGGVECPTSDGELGVSHPVSANIVDNVFHVTVGTADNRPVNWIVSPFLFHQRVIGQ